MTLTLIVATDRAGGIGIDNRLPWRLPEDLAHFKQVTTGHPIVMGRKTFESIGKPLPHRRNIVVTRNPTWSSPGVETVSSVESAVELIASIDAFVIGGAQIYAQALPLADCVIVTEIDKVFHCDTFFPELPPANWKQISRQAYYSELNACAYAFVTYQRL